MQRGTDPFSIHLPLLAFLLVSDVCASVVHICPHCADEEARIIMVHPNYEINATVSVAAKNMRAKTAS